MRVRGDDVTTKVRVFSLKKLFLKRFTVRSTTRTLIIDKTDHSAFTAIFSRSQYGGRGFFKKLVLIFSTSLVPLSGWLHPTRTAAACTSPHPPKARLPPSDAAELRRHASNHSIL